jgi:hypothetical protein
MNPLRQIKEGSFIRATFVWTTNLIVKKCFLSRPKSRHFNSQVSRRFFTSCLYSRLCINLFAGAIFLQDSAGHRQEEAE